MIALVKIEKKHECKEGEIEKIEHFLSLEGSCDGECYQCPASKAFLCLNLRKIAYFLYYNGFRIVEFE